MAIKFFNVKTGETREVNTEPLIAAFFNSGDQHVNVMQGQDFGWRLDVETLKRMKAIKEDPDKMNQLIKAFELVPDAVSDTDILRWISLEDARAEAAKNEGKQGDFTKQYEEKVRALDGDQPTPSTEAPATPPEQPTQSQPTPQSESTPTPGAATQPVGETTTQPVGEATTKPQNTDSAK